ncbi:ATP-dependent zinc metalloprotease FtsH [Actinomadura rubteroloni]|uniref:ATP-dependent zinc metalloprotease FtsH n=1 Tax=Actinomadura rubteroloni TaxID=1926885 RepID=A0A2P4UEV9_9ACTN|nr:ATP-dependent zinc metalloprotease FtsH [Actinomadura rubteroloni]POM23552.1 ATP-dependent zinc metalloprotease FtsH [Actinomadura rubteroloni]
MIRRVHLRPRRLGPPPDDEPPGKPPQNPPPPTWWQRWGTPVLLAVLLLLMFGPSLAGDRPTSLSYSAFSARLDAGRVKSVTIDEHGGLSGKLTDGKSFTSRVPTAIGAGDLQQRLRAEKVRIDATRSGGFGSFLLGLLPFALVIGFFLWFGRRAGGGLPGGAGGFGRVKAEVIEAERPTTRFADVAGYEGVKREIEEVVDFLRDPGRYAAAGAEPPRGVIMVGPPGTGKTLFARAVAGEAQVPFLSVTGSSFVEMFVGVGASRVRDLFADARKRAPSIVFIDEIDAIGGRRGGTMPGGGNEEREQTLNQLLAELDGFDQSSGIVVLAATNRPETLDPALLRPGRFDRQVVVPLPSRAERAAILAVHARGKHLDAGVDLERVARATPGFSGADLHNLLNEAAINAVRDDRTTITARDVDTARDRLLLGRRDTSNALLPDERRSVAVHESGHALLAALCENADPVAKVTILPAGMALGVTEQLPEAERHLYSTAYLTDLLTVRLGGRAAELVVFGQGSTGAADDLAGATRLAARMVREFGMSPRLGPVGYGSTTQNYLGDGPDETAPRPYSERTQQLVDEEVARLLREAEARAVRLLGEHRAALDRLADVLVRQETVDGSAVADALRAESALPGPVNGVPARDG